MPYHPVHRVWRWRRALWVMLPFELACTVACLALFGIAQPDTIRTELWEVGGLAGFNSRPNFLIYFYANYRPVPTTPFVWSQTLTDFNVAISIISLFTMIAKLVLIIMKIWMPLYSTLLHLALLILYIVSMYGQMGPDHLDERYPSSIAWYIRKSCDVAKPYGAEKSCAMAKGTFAATICMIVVLLVLLGHAVWSMLPNPQNDVKISDDDDDEEVGTGSENGREKGWEMHSLRSPVSPRSTTTTLTASGGPVPFTPRTQAFNALDRKLPLRH